MDTPAPGSSGLLGSLRGFADGLLGSVHDRVELFSLELHEEKHRLVQILIWISAIVFTGLLAVIFASFALVVWLWDQARLPVLICLAVGWLYLRSRTLMVPLVALTVLSGVILGTAFGAIPGFKHPTNLLVGKWEFTRSEEHRNAIPFEGLPLHFLRGGAVHQWNSRLQIAPSRISYRPLNYHWIGPDRIRLRWLKDTVDAAAQTTRVENEDVDYRVEVEYGQLTLTRLGDGKVFRYLRAIH